MEIPDHSVRISRPPSMAASASPLALPAAHPKLAGPAGLIRGEH